MPLDVDRKKAWALLNKHVYDRLQSNKRNWAPLQSWKHHQTKILQALGISGSSDTVVYSGLLRWWAQAQDGRKGVTREQLAAIEATVVSGVKGWALYGPLSSKDPVHGAVGFTDVSTDGRKCKLNTS